MGIAKRNNYGGNRGGVAQRQNSRYGGQAKRSSINRGAVDTTDLHRRLKRQALLRDNHTCVMCHASNHPDNPSDVLLTADHIIPVAQGGKYILSNYRTLCYKCHANRVGSVNKRAKNALLALGDRYKRSK